MNKTLTIAEVKKFYGNKCQFIKTTPTNQLQRFRWVPSKKYSIYNHMLNSMVFRRDIAMGFSNHKYTLFPEPNEIFNNNKLGEYHLIVEGKLSKYKIKLPIATKYLIYYHYIKHLEKYKIRPPMSSKRYINKYISKIIKLDWYFAYESYDDDVIMLLTMYHPRLHNL
jgi:hypothetical protein